MLEQLMIINIIIGNVAVDFSGLSFCIDSIALMPRGVAAPPIPRRFAEMFIDTYCLLSFERLHLPNILFIMGDRKWDNFCDKPLFSRIMKSPIQIAQIAHKLNDNFTAEFEAVSNPERTFVGSPKHSAIMLIINRKIQILFILKNMIEMRDL